MDAGVIDLIGLDAEQVSTDIGGPENAIDGNTATSSCTQDFHGNPWWMINLGEVYDVETVTVTLPREVGDLREYTWRHSLTD